MERPTNGAGDLADQVRLEEYATSRDMRMAAAPIPEDEKMIESSDEKKSPF